MKQCMNSENLHRRLKKIIGQVQAIDRMIDEDVPCEDVLAQLNAAKSALHKVGQVVLEGHISHCVRLCIINNRCYCYNFVINSKIGYFSLRVFTS